jgi:Uncharacterized protein containing a NRPS condensation (elongation) domain
MNDQIRAEIPVNGQDIANYVGQLWNKNEQIQIVLRFAQKIDYPCLNKAVRLSIDAEPVLGCEFIVGENKPVWERHSELDTVPWCTLIDTDKPEEQLHNVLCKPFRSLKYQLEVYLIRTMTKDILCIKINHACSDGGGAKDYLHLLQVIYSKIIRNEEYNLGMNDTGNRNGSQIFENLNISDPSSLINPRMAELRPTWAFPYQEKDVEKFNYAILSLSQEETNQLILFARENGVTLNDIILSAYYRALFSVIHPSIGQTMEICVTVDLRKYLPDKKAGAICNLSGVLNHRITREEEDSTATLFRVSNTMNAIKKDNPGLHSAASIEMLSYMDFKTVAASIQCAWEESVRSGKSTINLSNFGVLSEETIQFGDVSVEDAFFVTPVFRAPSFMLGASTYKNKLTFTVGFCEPEVQEADLKVFFSYFKKELDGFIK